MAFTLENFKSQIMHGNVARSSKFEVLITVPEGLKSKQYVNQNLVSLLCTSAHTPGVNLFTDDNYTEDGIRRSVAYDVAYQSLSLEFIVDNDYRVKYFFDDWYKLINPDRRTFEYPDYYTADKIYLNLISAATENKVTYGYIYNNIYPKSINTINLNSSNPNYTTFTVDFVFETFEHYKPR